MTHSPIILIPTLSLVIVLIAIMSRQQHLLPTLLCLERLILFIIYLLPSIRNRILIIISPLIVIILSIRVSRASIGLRLLVITRRNRGNDSTLHPALFSC